MKKIFSILIILLVGMACGNPRLEDERLFTPNIKQIRIGFEKRFEPVEDYYHALIDNGLVYVGYDVLDRVELECEYLLGYYHGVWRKYSHLTQSDDLADTTFIKEVIDLNRVLKRVELEVNKMKTKQENDISEVRQGLREIPWEKKPEPETIDNLRVRFLVSREPVEEYVHALRAIRFNRHADITLYGLELETNQLIEYYKENMEEHPFKEGNTQEENELAEAIMYLYYAANSSCHQVKEHPF